MNTLPQGEGKYSIGLTVVDNPIVVLSVIEREKGLPPPLLSPPLLFKRGFFLS